MSVEEKPAARGSLAPVVATAAITLAVGITAAAVSGYLVPKRDSGIRAQAPTAVATPTGETAAIEPSGEEVQLASHRWDDDDDDDDHDKHHRRGRKHRDHHDKEHDDDHDD